MKMPNLKTMPFSDLLKLQADVNILLKSHRAELEAQVDEIDRVIGHFNTTSRRGGRAGPKVLAKYRHPKTGQEWSGRGMMAKWLAAEVKAGKKRDSFLIT